MKKIVALSLVLIVMLSAAACGGKPGGAPGETSAASGETAAASGEVLTDAFGNVANVSGSPSDGGVSYREKFDQLEYAQYINIFYQSDTSYDSKKMTKDGTFAIVQDKFNGVTRYYVWGYADKTRCCDYQWEFVPNDPAALPPEGSYIKVTGTFEVNDAALDKRWINGADVEVVEPFAPEADLMDLTLMSPTLTYVQIANIQNFAAEFAGQKLRVYGRAYGPATLEHPYYDSSAPQYWQLDFISDEKPATGVYVTLTGTFDDGALTVSDMVAYD